MSSGLLLPPFDKDSSVHQFNSILLIEHDNNRNCHREAYRILGIKKKVKKKKPWPCYTWVTDRKWNSLPFTPVSVMHLQGVQLTTCARISSLPASLSLEGQRSLPTVRLKTLNLQHTFTVFLQSNHIHQCHYTVFNPRPESMTYFPLMLLPMFLAGSHWDALGFTLQNIGG